MTSCCMASSATGKAQSATRHGRQHRIRDWLVPHSSMPKNGITNTTVLKTGVVSANSDAPGCERDCQSDVRVLVAGELALDVLRIGPG